MLNTHLYEITMPQGKTTPEINFETDDKVLVITNREQYTKFMACGRPKTKSIFREEREINFPKESLFIPIRFAHNPKSLV
jgi:hypothetical protein